jgi:hypothetical protein
VSGAARAHAGVATRWQTLPLVEQLAHVGGEVERALRAHEARMSDRREHALARALELFDLTAADPRWRGARRREVLRAREEFCAHILAERSPANAAGLRRYFLAFAVLARRR